MPVRYSKQIEKTGAAVGSVVSIVRPSTYTTSNTESIESGNWDIANTYPGWLECDGRTLNVSDYRALYSVIGNTYGGVTGSTFKLPDYRSKKICGTGTLNGGSGSSLSLPSVISPTGIPGGDQNTAGSSGGFYILDTFRQLPSDSEITPGSPTSPGTLGGTSVDTFSLGTFVSSGFSNVTESRECELTGTVTYGVGPCSNVSVSGTPPHFHFTELTRLGSTRATSGDPAAGASYNFFNSTTGTIRSFNRGLRRWPGAAGTGFGGYELYGEPSVLQGLGALAINTNGDTGVAIRSYGSGTGLNGFENYGGSTTNQYLAFARGNSNNTVRQATFTVEGTLVTEFFIYAIAGNDSNGGERVNTAGEGLKLSFNGVPQPGYILPSRDDFSGDYDFEFQNWKERTYPIDPVYRTPTLVITLEQSANAEGDTGYNASPPTDWDSFGIGILGVRGTGPDYEYTGGDTPIILQRHSHMVFWDEPNAGDTVPGTLSTYGTGGFADLDYVTGLPNGLKSGGAADVDFTPNSSVGTSITKTLSILTDIGTSIRPATITMSNSSRVAFDNAISVRLQAAEELVLLSPYFRSKYIIKAY